MNNLNNLEATLEQSSKANLGNKPAKPLQKEARKSHGNTFELEEESKERSVQENEKTDRLKGYLNTEKFEKEIIYKKRITKIQRPS